MLQNGKADSNLEYSRDKKILKELRKGNRGLTTLDFRGLFRELAGSISWEVEWQMDSGELLRIFSLKQKRKKKNKIKGKKENEQM